MYTALLAPHPFGHQIQANELREKFSRHQPWEDRYRQLIQLGRQLPRLDETLKNAETELSGCENRVWLGWQMLPDGTLHFYGDSEGRIVKGLLAVLLTAIEGLTPAALRMQDPLQLFSELGLKDQLSASRSNGLQALALAVTQAANQAELT
ncbi:cysteine desulfurase sulfur acceptor subunit CsdE [Enterobacteriaceae bacterium LUAb1]